jgi:uncharacterized protein YxeA
MDVQEKNNSHETKKVILTLIVIIVVILAGWYFIKNKNLFDSKQREYTTQEKEDIIRNSGLSNEPSSDIKGKEAILKNSQSSNTNLSAEEKEKIIQNSK